MKACCKMEIESSLDVGGLVLIRFAIFRTLRLSIYGVLVFQCSKNNFSLVNFIFINLKTASIIYYGRVGLRQVIIVLIDELMTYTLFYHCNNNFNRGLNLNGDNRFWHRKRNLNLYLVIQRPMK